METTSRDTFSRTACESMFVKWESPAAELEGTARLIEAFVYRRVDAASDLAIAVPNMAWAIQAKQACDQAGVTASVRAGAVHLSAATRSRLALLEVIAHPDDPQLADRWRVSGHTDAELSALLERYGAARAAALVRLCDLESCPELSHGLLHICGDESAGVLFETLGEQLACPTSPEGLEVVSIVPLTHLAQVYSQLFVIGCVDGLLPEPGQAADALPTAAGHAEGKDPSSEAAVEASGAATSGAAYASAKEAFLDASRHATKRLYYSGFAKADVDFAQRAHLSFTRVKREGDRELAMCRISPYFAAFGASRPSTLGGQALLRKYQLN